MCMGVIVCTDPIEIKIDTDVGEDVNDNGNKNKNKYDTFGHSYN